MLLHLKKWFPNQYLRVMFGAFVVIGLTMLVGSQTYNGSGGELLNLALMEGSARPYDFALKLLFTAITLSCGFKGGGVFPAFIVGATFGCLFGQIIGLSPSLCAAVGLIAVFCGVTNCPISSMLIAFELFGYDLVHILLLQCIFFQLFDI